MSTILVGLQQIQQKIIDVLKGHPALIEPGKIQKYYYGQPDPQALHFPYISVEEVTGPVEPSTVNKLRYTLRFQITIVDKNADNDAAEKSVQDKAEYVLKALLSDPTLGGNVQALWFSNLEVDRLRSENYALAGVRLMLEAVKEV